MLVQAIIVTIAAAILSIEQNNGQFGFARPLVAGTVLGIVLGDPAMGVILGAEMQLIFMGVSAIGGSVPPDYLIGTCIATALAIMTNADVEVALALAVPAAVAGQSVNILGRTINTVMQHWADKAADEGKYGKLELAHYMGGVVTAARTALVVFPVVFIGASALDSIMGVIPQWILTGLSAAGSILPIVGFGMLLKYLDIKHLLPFFFIGFALSVFGGFSMVGATMIAICVALLFDHYSKGSKAEAAAPADDLDELMN